jgi:ribosomal protein L12E/L44/L45/RPP1/RPP2
METLTIKVKDTKALKLIHDLEDLDLIQVIETTSKNQHANLSQLLKGSIAPADAEKMQQELKEMRNEWERDTY